MTLAEVSILAAELQCNTVPEIASGRELVFWDDLRKGRATISNAALSAAHRLLRLDMRALVDCLTTRDRNSVASVLAFLYIDWSDQVGEHWLAVPSAPIMFALGVQIWLRHATENWRGTDADLGRLQRIEGAIRKHADTGGTNAAAVWWQIVSIAPRLESRHDNSHMAQLVNIAANVTAKAGYLPSDEELVLHEHSNPASAAVLPFVARLVDDGLRAACTQAFQRAVARFIARRGRVSVATQCDILFLDSCARNIRDAPSDNWWEVIAIKLLRVDVPFAHEPSDEDCEKAVWLLVAACAGVMCYHRETGNVPISLVASIISIADRSLSRLFWEPSQRGPLWQELAKLLASCFALDPATAEVRILRVAREVDSADMTRPLLDGGGSVLTADAKAEIETLIQRRTAFAKELSADQC